jgi:serine/threonine-protein kinase RsbW
MRQFSKSIELEIEPCLASLGGLSDFMNLGRASLGFSEKCRHALELAAEEAVNNVIQHACRPGDDWPIRLSLTRQNHWVTLVIEDEGQPFQDCDTSKPDLESPLMKRNPGGLGLHIIENMADRVERLHDCGINRLIISKKL